MTKDPGVPLVALFEVHFGVPLEEILGAPTNLKIHFLLQDVAPFTINLFRVKMELHSLLQEEMGFSGEGINLVLNHILTQFVQMAIAVLCSEAAHPKQGEAIIGEEILLNQ